MVRRQRSDGTDCIVEWWAGWERVKGVRVKGKQAARRAICATGKWVLFPKNYFLGEVSRRDAPRLARHVNGGCGDMRAPRPPSRRDGCPPPPSNVPTGHLYIRWGFRSHPQ